MQCKICGKEVSDPSAMCSACRDGLPASETPQAANAPEEPAREIPAWLFPQEVISSIVYEPETDEMAGASRVVKKVIPTWLFHKKDLVSSAVYEPQETPAPAEQPAPAKEPQETPAPAEQPAPAKEPQETPAWLSRKAAVVSEAPKAIAPVPPPTADATPQMPAWLSRKDTGVADAPKEIQKAKVPKKVASAPVIPPKKKAAPVAKVPSAAQQGHGPGIPPAPTTRAAAKKQERPRSVPAKPVAPVPQNLEAAEDIPSVWRISRPGKHEKNRKIAGLMAILLGGIGAHKFYLGQYKWGVLYLSCCWTCIPILLGIIEGIMLLTMKDGTFLAIYENKNWPTTSDGRRPKMPSLTFHNSDYAEFAPRLVASAIDLAVCAALAWLWDGPHWQSYLAVPLLYYAAMECAPWRGTLGKVLQGLVVTDINGWRISLDRAILHHAARFVMVAPLLVCYLSTQPDMGGAYFLCGIFFILSYGAINFTESRRGLHDVLAQCRVLKKQVLSRMSRFENIEKLAALYVELVKKGEIKAALAQYRDNLEDVSSNLPPPLTAIYHFYLWMEKTDNTRAIDSIAELGRKSPEIERAVRLAHSLARQLHLSRALRQPTSAAVPDAPGELALEKLALAVLETRLPSNELDACASAKNVKTRIAAIDPRQLPATTVPCYDALALWADWQLGHFENIRHNLGRFPELQQNRQFILALTRAAVKQNMAAGRLQEALETTAVAGQPKDTAALRFVCGFDALDGQARRHATAWFSHHQDWDIQIWSNIFSFALGISWFASGDYRQGNQALDRLIARCSAGAEQLGFPHILRQDALATLYFFKALALLAQFASEVKADGKSLGREFLEQLRAVAAAAAAPDSWQGNLVAGLAAYLDSSVSFGLDRLEKFKAAVENLAGRHGLKTIENHLFNRLKATDEAVHLLRSGQYRKLQELQHYVLSPLGNGIPALVMAAVHMTLWKEGLADDPLPELERLLIAGHGKVLIEKCIAHVEYCHALSRLRQKLRDIDTEAPSADHTERWAAIAVTVIETRQGKWQEAHARCSRIDDGGDPQFARMRSFLMFYLSWRMGNQEKCREILSSEAPGNPYIDRYRRLSGEIGIRLLLQALENDRTEEALLLLDEKLHGDGADPARFVIGFSIWLAERRNFAAADNFLALVEANSGPGATPEFRIAWEICFLRGLIFTGMGRYLESAEIFGRMLAVETPAGAFFRGPEGTGKIHGWCHFFKLHADMALAAHSPEQWLSLLSSLQRLAREDAPPHVRALACLAVSADRLIGAGASPDDPDLLAKLAFAQQLLPLKKYAGTLEKAASHLTWQREITEQFCRSIAQRNFRQAEKIYRQELVPAFGDKVPDAVQLCMAIAQWGERTCSRSEFHFAARAENASESRKKTIRRIENYMAAGERVREITRLLQARDYEGIVEFVYQNQWSEEGDAMPEPVAIAFIYACYKKNMGDAARHLRGTQGCGWERNYGIFLHGYLLAEEREWQSALEVFAALPTQVFSGHDIDRYRAGCNFVLGRQHLEAGERTEAMAAFSRCTAGKAESGIFHLLMYLGVNALYRYEPEQALQPFSMLSGYLQSVADGADIAYFRLLADMATLLCQKDTEKAGEISGGKVFLELLELPGADRDPKVLERTLRVLAVCQELSKERRLSPGQRTGMDELRKFLESQIEGLDKLTPEDPVLLVLKATVAINMGSSSVDQPVKLLTKAAQLGVNSPKMRMLLSRHEKEYLEVIENKSEVIALFDGYFTSREIPTEFKTHLSRHGDVRKMYRENCNYGPEDIAEQPVEDEESMLCERVEHALAALGETGAQTEKNIVKLREKAGRQLADVKNAESGLLDLEKKIMLALSARMHPQ